MGDQRRTDRAFWQLAERLGTSDATAAAPSAVGNGLRRVRQVAALEALGAIVVAGYLSFTALPWWLVAAWVAFGAPLLIFVTVEGLWRANREHPQVPAAERPSTRRAPEGVD